MMIINKINSTRLLSKVLQKFSTWPKFTDTKSNPKTLIKVLHSSEYLVVPLSKQQAFKKESQITIQKQQIKQIYINQKIQQNLDKKLNFGIVLKNDTHIQFSQKIMQSKGFEGLASGILSTAYKFTRKQKEKKQVKISLGQFRNKDYVLELVNARLRAKQWANIRGDEGNPAFYLKQAEKIEKLARQKHGDKIKITVIKGDELLTQGFRLMHAVGRASQNESIFINLSYNGNPQSQVYHSMVGKGVCFDSGGLNLKPTGGIKQMHMDMHGAASILSAFQSITSLGLKVNLTVSLGFVQNFVSNNSYRPLDIIQSRKGLTVEIGNTDAQGRLVLADCMHWTQENFKVQDLIQLSTLTGAIIVALGKKHAGLFTNSDELSTKLIQTGNIIGQKLWRMPVDTYHHDMIKPKTADLTNSPGKGDAGSCQAAAFLQNFVQKDVKWAHIDIAGTSNIDSDATGYGSRLLIEYIKGCI